MITATSSEVGALATSTTTKTTPVSSAPKPLIAERLPPARRALAPASARTMPAWPMVKAMNTPTA